MRALSFTFFLFAILAALTGCGTPGAPLPPSLGIPKPVGDLRATRKGDTVNLTWSAPTDTTDGALVRKPGKMQVSRIVSDNGLTGRTTQVVGDVPLEPALKEPEPPAPTAQDSIASLLQAPDGNFAVYSVLSQNGSGKSSGPSNLAAVPLVPTLPPPARVEATAVPLGISLSWDQAPSPENRSHLTSQYAYRVMRREQGAKASPVMVKQLNAGGGAAAFVDTGIEWQKHYDYWVTPVTLWQGAGKKGVVEGNDSPTTQIFADDKFPPDAPVGLQAVFSGLADQPFIDLAWTPNTEPDLAGYNVYRHSGDEPPVKINTELVKTPAYRDTTVKPGTKYFYSVSAVDLRNNESGKSAETSESVP
jgi:hypothetical protein